MIGSAGLVGEYTQLLLTGVRSLAELAMDSLRKVDEKLDLRSRSLFVRYSLCSFINILSVLSRGTYFSVLISH